MDPHRHADDPADDRTHADDMRDAPSWQEVLAVGNLAARLAGDGPDQAYAACAHMVRNRMRSARREIAAGAPCHARFGDGTWTGACVSLGSAAGMPADPPGNPAGDPRADRQIGRAHV